MLQLLHAQRVEITQALLVDRGGDAHAEQRGVEGLGQIILGACLDAAHRRFDLLRAGNHDHRQRERGLLLDRLQQLQPVHLGHLDIEQHEIEGGGADAFERLPSVPRLRHRPDAQFLQGADQAKPYQATVVHHQHVGAGQHIGRCARFHGHGIDGGGLSHVTGARLLRSGAG